MSGHTFSLCERSAACLPEFAKSAFVREAILRYHEHLYGSEIARQIREHESKGARLEEVGI
jgi:hypothetical protein